MKIIITADPEDIPAVAALILEKRHLFERHPSRPGWGWSFNIPNGKSFFLAEIKGGISARPSKPYVSRAKGQDEPSISE